MIIVIVGPTGSGKTLIAYELSKYLSDAPIINADAYQVYKDMNIGTAKCKINSDLYLRHRLMDIKSPEEEFSVMEYQKLFRSELNELLSRHKHVIVCGGTGLYIRASLYDYKFDEEIKDDTSDLEKLNNDELWELLIKLDEAATNNIHKNNRKRVIRAISIARTSDVLKSENISSQTHKMIYDEKNVKIFNINIDRKVLYENINKRVDDMINCGLVDEVKNLLNKYNLSKTSKAAIGYKEIISYLDNEISLIEAIELIKKRTRNYAKRQITFFKHQLPCINVNNIEEIKEVINNESY
jgi:tRNA dimethylallyltransferase